MKHYWKLIVVAAIAALILVNLTSLAAFAATAPTPPPPIDPRILVKTVDVKGGTVSVQYMRDAKKPPQVYKVDDITQIQVNNAPAKISDIKTGMQVREYVERDDQTLDKICVDKADPGPVIPKKK